MCYKTNVILYDSYVEALMSKAIHEDYVKHLFDGQVDDRGIHSPLKTAALEMLLLYDKVYLLDADSDVDYTKLTNTGFVEVITNVDKPSFVGNIPQEYMNSGYVMAMKPRVLDVLKSRAEAPLKRTLRINSIDINTYYSCYYDLLFCPDIIRLSEEDTEMVNKAVELLARSLQENAKSHGSMMGYEEAKVIEENKIRGELGGLLTLLETSNETNSNIVQNYYGMFDIKNSDNNPIFKEDYKDAFGILQISLGNIIGSLPKLDSISHVLYLKDKKHKEITRLREILDEIHKSIKEVERHKVISKLEDEIKLASIELAKGEQQNKVSRWITYSSIPMSLIGVLAKAPYITAVGLAGLGTSIVGTYNQLGSDLHKKYGWIEILR